MRVHPERQAGIRMAQVLGEGLAPGGSCGCGCPGRGARCTARAFPWVRFLPRKAVQEFLLEFVETARASTSLGSLAPITTVIAAWKHTAEIYADPELHATLTQDHGDGDGDGDFGDVPVLLSEDE